MSSLLARPVNTTRTLMIHWYCPACTPIWSQSWSQIGSPMGPIWVAHVGPIWRFTTICKWASWFTGGDYVGLPIWPTKTPVGLMWVDQMGFVCDVHVSPSWFTNGDHVVFPMWPSQAPEGLKWVDQMGFVCGIHVSPTWFTSGGHVSPTWNLPITHLKHTRVLLTTHKKLITSIVLLYIYQTHQFPT